MMYECVASGDHVWAGSSQCIMCGARLRCQCGCYLREDNMAIHFTRCRWLERAFRQATVTAFLDELLGPETEHEIAGLRSFWEEVTVARWFPIEPNV